MNTISASRRFAALAFAVLAALALPMEALAQTSCPYDGVTCILCIISQTVDGNVGKAIGTLAIITLGITLLFGRASWMQALIIGTGIAVIFGAGALMAILVGGGNICNV